MKGAIIFACLAAVAAAMPAELKTTTTSCTLTICADYVNSCGLGYGGCFPACRGYTTPSWSIPPCPSTTTTRRTTTKSIKTLSTNTTKSPTKTTTSKKPCQTICVDAVNECGIKYGGCYCRDQPFPFPKPPCKTTTTPVTYPTATPGPKKCGGLAGFQCGKGEICIDDPTSPCGIAVDCLGICVVPEFCGGIANFQCSKKTDVCIDDPRDDCSVKTGGADCGGLCVPKAWTK